MDELFSEHLKVKQEIITKICDDLNFSNIYIYSGENFYYPQDDQHVPFRAYPHFLHHCPEDSPGHLLKLTPGKKPELCFLKEDDFWHDHRDFSSSFWFSYYDVKIFKTKNELWSYVADKSEDAYIGPDCSVIKNRKFQINPKLLVHALNWYRCIKTDYEISCLSIASKKAAEAHKIARQSFLEGKSEYQIHMDYLASLQVTEHELPYGSIVGTNEKSAILHYQNKRHLTDNKVMLIDAGARYLGYCSDITRTYIRKKEFQIFFKVYCMGLKKFNRTCVL